jgi:hypothetical protein
VFTQQKVKDIRSENGCLVGKTEKGALAIYAPNLNSFLNHVKVAYPEPNRDGHSSSPKGSGSFYSFDSYEQAQDVYLNRPWEVVKFQEIDHTLVSPENEGGDVYFDVTGDYLDVGRFLDGEPEHFGNAYLGNPRGLFITIYASTLSVWHISEQALQRKQQRITALIDWLESQQIRTRLVAINDNSCGDFEVVLKEFHESLNLNPIAVTFHPDYLRRIVFRAMEHSSTWSGGYGSSVSNIKVEDGGLSIMIPSNQGEIKEIDTYFDKLITSIAKKIEENDILCTITE